VFPASLYRGYRLANKKEYKDVIVETAKSLSTRFRPNAGVIQFVPGRDISCLSYNDSK